jgi:hypothetical protein
VAHSRISGSTGHAERRQPGLSRLPDRPTTAERDRIVDTVSGGHIDLNTGLVSSLYNPYATVPSMHVGYALVVGVSLLRYGRQRVLRFLIGALYPPFALLVVVATGNDFLFDALSGGAALDSPNDPHPARVPEEVAA